MRKFTFIGLILACGLALFTASHPGQAQAAAVQEITGIVTAATPRAQYAITLNRGDTLYVYAASNAIDTYLLLCADPNCSIVLVENDDINLQAGNLNSALTYREATATTLYIAVSDCCDVRASGSFRLVVGLNAPDVLNGTAVGTGASILMPVDTATPPDSGAGTPPPVLQPGEVNPTLGEIPRFPEQAVQEITFNVTPDTPRRYYDLFSMRAGDTLYIYAESDTLDTYLVLCDINCEDVFAENDDIDFAGGNLNSALQFTFTEEGDYSILITDCCDEQPNGSFRLQIGLNTPDVLTGQGVPNTDRLAELWRPEPVLVQSLEGDRPEPVACDNALLQPRPVLSGPVQTLETQNFILHFTTQGVDATTLDFAQQVQNTLEDMARIQIGQGWPLPPNDCGEGGDTRFDIYMREIIGELGAVGYASPENVVVDNPNSPNFQETWAAYSHLVIDNDFSLAPNPVALMRATVAHEFHHAIQFGYDINDALPWYYEATATWMETQTYPDQEDATPYTVDLLETMDWCVGSRPQNRLRIYAEWTLIDSLAQDFGPASIQRLWEIIADQEGMDSYYMFLQEFGTTPQAQQLNLAVRNLLLDYALGARIPGVVRLEGVINGPGIIGPRLDGVQELGVDYLNIATPGLYTLATNAANLAVYVVGINQNNNTVQVLDVNGGRGVDTRAYTSAYALILNTHTHNDPAACTFTNWQLTVADGVGAPPPDVLPVQFNPQNYIPAR
ncbi:MAG: MXAN_6640 family putative metalloprotease [Anaerolineales bacterium]